VRWPLLLSVLAACGVDQPAGPRPGVDPVVRRQRAEVVRDTAARMGLHNAALLGGIAMAETGFAHCAAESAHACRGPASDACGGGPVIAGAADGPCAAKQGGLGMFQFDAGTYAQTLAQYGDGILTVEGSAAEAVAFVVEKAQLDIPAAKDRRAALAWLDSIPMDAGAPAMAAWAQLMACRYNGCCAATTTCAARAAGYRDHALAIYREYGADFWRVEPCAAPADGVIAASGPCFVQGGLPGRWRAGGVLRTTDWDAPTAYADWLVRAKGRFRVEAHVAGGTAVARYEVHHAGTVDTARVDQAKGDWAALGTFAFTGDGTEFVTVADNTNDPGKQLAIDAVRLVAR